MSYKPFIPNVTGFVTGLLPVKDETGNKKMMLLPEVEHTLVTDVTDVTGKKLDTYTQSQLPSEELQKGGHVSATGNAVTLAVFPEVERVTGMERDRLQNRLQKGETNSLSNTSSDYGAYIDQVVSAQRLYELQRETAAIGWTIHGVRHGPVIDGYCDEWMITRLVAPAGMTNAEPTEQADNPAQVGNYIQ